MLKALKAGVQRGEQERSPQQTLWGERQKLAHVGACGPGLVLSLMQGSHRRTLSTEAVCALCLSLLVKIIIFKYDFIEFFRERGRGIES